MILSELETLVKNLTFEDAATGTSGLVSTAQLDSIIDFANKKWYRAVVASSPSVYTVRSADVTYSNASGFYDFSGLDVNGVYLITNIEAKYNSQYYQIDKLETPQDRRNYQLPWGIYLPAVLPSVAEIEGQKIYLFPVIASDFLMRLSYVPNLPTLSGSTQALGGQLAQFHEIVAYEAAMMLGGKDLNQVRMAMWRTARDEMAKQLVDYLSRSIRSGPRGTRNTSSYSGGF